MSDLRLSGYRYSVYTRIARIVLHEKRLDYTYIEVDPFSDTPDTVPHPFGRVPTLMHGKQTIYETAAITRYLDAAFPDPALTPTDPLAQARMTQVISIIDNYGYWPMVRQVFAHGFFRQIEKQDSDPQEIKAGLTASEQVLQALEHIADEGVVLAPKQFTLACAHLAPMLDYFMRAPGGAQTMKTYPKQSAWFKGVEARASFKATRPDLPAV